MVKILILGNEFLSFDSLAKEVGKLLSKDDFDIININDSFQLMQALNDFDFPIILDVVKGINEVKLIPQESLISNSIVSAHDFDAAKVIKLINKPVKIIGIPIAGDVNETYKKVKLLLEQ